MADKEFENYKICVDFLKFEATTLWQIFNSFFIGNNIFIVIIASLLAKKEATSFNFPLLLIAGIVGLAVAILWFGTFRRNSHWYSYRMEQAKKAEEEYVNSTEDEKWYLLNREAKKFADGGNIKGLKNNISGYGMITIFMIIYIALIIWSLFNLACRC